MAFKGKIKVNLDFPKFDHTRDLKEIGDKVILPDIEGRMNSSIDINGKSYRQNDAKTLQMKSKRGLQNKPLIATGQLRKSFKSTIVKKGVIKLSPVGVRRSHFGEKVISNKELSDILQNQGVRTKLGKRFFEFFGISDKAEGKAIAFMKNQINKRVDRGGRRIVR